MNECMTSQTNPESCPPKHNKSKYTHILSFQSSRPNTLPFTFKRILYSSPTLPDHEFYISPILTHFHLHLSAHFQHTTHSNSHIHTPNHAQYE